MSATQSETTRRLPDPPAWFNLDALVTPEERKRVADIRDEIVDLMHRVIELAPRIRWATSLSDERFEECSAVESSFLLMDTCIGADEIRWIATVLGLLLDPDSTCDAQVAIENTHQFGHADLQAALEPLAEADRAAEQRRQEYIEKRKQQNAGEVSA